MLPRIIVAVLLIIAISYAINKYQNQSPETRKKLRAQYAIGGIALLLLILTVTGRLNWIGAALAALLVAIQRLLPVAIRVLPIIGMFGKHRGIPTGIPTMRTKFLTIEINYLTGAISGRVTNGLHQGRTLSELDSESVNELLQHYQERDPESYKLLLAYLQYQPHQSKRQENQGSQHSNTNLTADEARQILGVDSNATREEIIAAHKKLIQKLHPDRGGSPYLAAKVNQAKDILIGKNR